jgi:hypothetical protein
MRLGKHGFGFGFPDCILERQPLARDVGVRHRRIGASELIQEGLPGAVVDRSPRFARIALKALKRPRQERLIISH